MELLEATPGELANSGFFALNPEAAPGTSGLSRFVGSMLADSPETARS